MGKKHPPGTSWIALGTVLLIWSAINYTIRTSESSGAEPADYSTVYLMVFLGVVLLIIGSVFKTLKQ